MLNYNHLLELAETESNPPGMGAPRQATLRRAGSTAYYAVFHALLASTAISFVPQDLWKARVLFYRALEHSKTRDRCKRLGQNPLGQADQTFLGFPAFPQELRTFANGFVRLQELRHRCDYDPEFKLTKAKAQAQQIVADAREAIEQLEVANQDARVLFLGYLLFGLRAT